MYKDFIERTKMFNPNMKDNKIATKEQYYEQVYFPLYNEEIIKDSKIN